MPKRPRSFLRLNLLLSVFILLSPESFSQTKINQSKTRMSNPINFTVSPGRVVVSRRKRKGMRSQSHRWSVNTLFQWKSFWKSRQRRRSYRLKRKARRMSLQSRSGKFLMRNSEIEKYEISDLKALSSEKTLAFIEDFKNDPDILVEADFKVTKLDAGGSPVESSNDPYFLPASGAWGQSFFDQWPLEKLEIQRAWSVSQGEGSLVAIIDTGVDYNHPELQGQIVKGLDFANNDDDPIDDNGHGTHLAGTVVSQWNNGIGIAGVAPSAKVLAIKVLDAEGSGYLSDVSEAIRYAVDSGAHVINLSLGTFAPDYPTYFSSAMDYAQEKNVVVVASAGNDSMDVRFVIPANDPVAIAVGATNFLDQRASFSNYGQRLSLTAPGGGDNGPDSISEPSFSVLSLKSQILEAGLDGFVVGDQYLRLGGTSMAAPHVAGVAALLRSRFPDATSLQIRQMLQQGAQDIYTNGFDSESGFGRLNALRALEIENPLEVQITNRSLSLSPTNQIELNGIVRGSGLSDWRVVLDDSKTILSGNDPVVGPLGTWNLLEVSKGYHTLELQARDLLGREFKFRTDLQINKSLPESPSQITATIEGSGVRLNWIAPSNWGGSSLTGYVIEYSANNGDWRSLLSLSSNETTALVTNLPAGFRYSFRVAATNSEGTGAFSAASQSVLLVGEPSIPQVVKLAPQDTCVLVTWESPVQSGGVRIAHYRVRSSISTDFQTTQEKEFQFCGLLNGEPISFQVSAVNSAGLVSDWSDYPPVVIPFGVPEPPQIISVEPTSNQVILNWTKPRENGRPIIDYVIQLRSSDQPNWTAFETPPALDLSAVISPLVNGISYEFRVAARNEAGQSKFSSPSDPAKPLGLPSAPTIQLIEPEDRRVVFTVLKPQSDGGDPELSYQFWFSVDRGTTWEEKEATLNPLENDRFQATLSLQNQVPYLFRLAASNSVGQGEAVQTQEELTLVGTPEAPRNIEVTHQGNGFIELRWIAPEKDGGSALLGYVIEVSTAQNESWGQAQEVDILQNQTRVSGLTNGLTYQFTVRAKNSYGVGLASESVQTVPLGPPPLSPLNLIATGQEGKVELRWEAPQNNGGYEIEDYGILVARAGTGRPLYQHYDDGISAETRTVVLGLEPGVAYEFKVAARNRFKSFENPKGQGPYSEPVIATPLLPTEVVKADTLLLGSKIAGNQSLESENGKYRLYIKNGRVWVTRQFTWRGRKFTLRRRTTPGNELSFETVQVRNRSYARFSIKDARGRLRYRRSWVPRNKNYLKLDNDGRLRVYELGKPKAFRVIY